MADTVKNKLIAFFKNAGRAVCRLASKDKLAFGIGAAVVCCVILDLALGIGKLASAQVPTEVLPVEQTAPVENVPTETEENVSAPFDFSLFIKPARAMTNSLSFSPEPEESAGQDTFSSAGSMGGGIWVQIPGTYINSAVAQGSDNSFYLTHNIYGGYDWRGCIYANCDCNMSSVNSLSQNTVLFGHNKATNRYGGEVSNFTTLPRFQDYAHASANRVIYLSIGGEQKAFVVFAAFDLAVREESSFPYWRPSISSSILSGAISRSYWNYGIDVNTSDKILTLSTCSYDWGYDANYNTYAKFVVMARALRPGETFASFGNISANSARRTPAGLYRVQS